MTASRNGLKVSAVGLYAGQRFQLSDLSDGEVRRIDIASALHQGSANTVLIVSHGRRGASASVVIGDT